MVCGGRSEVKFPAGMAGCKSVFVCWCHRLMVLGLILDPMVLESLGVLGLQGLKGTAVCWGAGLRMCRQEGDAGFKVVRGAGTEMEFALKW